MTRRVMLMSDGSLLEAIAAVVLDNTTLTFAPAAPEGTSLPTAVVIGVRHVRDGRAYEHAREVGFGELSLSGAAEKVLANAIADTMAPMIHEALDDESTGELAITAGAPQPPPYIPEWVDAADRMV